MEYERMQQASQLNELVGKHFRDKYLNPPHYSGEISKNLLESLKKFIQNKQFGQLEVETLPHCSGQYVLPLEYKGWKPSSLFPHAASKALAILQNIEREVVGNTGEKEIEYLFGTALYIQQNTSYVAIAISWRYGPALRRARRAAQNIQIDSNNLATRLTAELRELRLSRGLSAKVSQEFARVLNQSAPSLPTNFSSHSLLVLKYNAALSPESICDHAYDSALKHVTQHSPEEFDTHLAVLCVFPKGDASTTETEPASSSIPPEIVIYIARLWRSKAQMLQQLQKIPAKIDSRQLETILRERVSAFQGLEPATWSTPLSQQLFSVYNPSNPSKHAPAIPEDCVWLNHTAVTFHNWPVRSIIGFVSTNTFWNSAGHHTKPVAVLRCAVSVLSCGGPTSIHLSKEVAQQNTDTPLVQAYGSETSLTVAMAVAWSWMSDKYTQTSVPVPITLEDNDEEMWVVATPSIPSVQSMNAPGSADKTLNTLDSRASVRHYNVEPRLVSALTREIMWPTPIIPRLLLSGEMPTANLGVLDDYGITHIVVTSSHIPCTFSSQKNYLKMSENDDFLLQIQTFIAFIESLSQKGQTDHTVLVAGRRGRNRSAGLVVALVMKHAGLTLREAVTHVAARRNIQLAEFVKQALLKFVSQPNSLAP